VNAQLQRGLFTHTGEVAIDTSFRGTVRTVLDATSWVEVVSDWLSGSEQLFDELLDRVPWQQHHRVLFRQRFLEPRLTAEYRDIQNVPHPDLLAAAAALSAHYRVRYDGVWLNLYRDGRDSTGWHRDRFSCRRPECIVPVLTLGTTRHFLIKPRRGGASIGFSPRSGDLLVMGGRCQEDWLHGVPKEMGAGGARISVNFQSSAQARRR
jgi:alkylated DNA repair dioxygenase AlkB